MHELDECAMFGKRTAMSETHVLLYYRMGSRRSVWSSDGCHTTYKYERTITEEHQSTLHHQQCFISTCYIASKSTMKLVSNPMMTLGHHIQNPTNPPTVQTIQPTPIISSIQLLTIFFQCLICKISM